jgi:hypothetical protein
MLLEQPPNSSTEKTMRVIERGKRRELLIVDERQMPRQQPDLLMTEDKADGDREIGR